ncbi:MAG: hypothetical protein QOK49_1022 [Baekduia sp.]|nr:hypothetical protein [Baekduia sp.]MDX6726217.1 hypothetical protein [Baekduia sp.]
MSPWQLPDPVCDHVDETLELRFGAGELEQLARLDTIKLSLPGGASVAQLMNLERDDPYQRVDSFYSAPDPVAIRGGQVPGTAIDKKLREAPTVIALPCMVGRVVTLSPRSASA